ncbi:hypothetical protein PE067_14010 [Paracoccus sp. DMF-8]|uniref:hypothetical protein n=1 Tax=Paracoccus sp. DMF-8 TaxID=3019445 RepID=UPI0023E7E0B2|nr:hypothetical protein [Paracoccus sp. DMF-8]MDF3607150.1 hypothetical protein [Paracoccus sp. DMF-8]
MDDLFKEACHCVGIFWQDSRFSALLIMISLAILRRSAVERHVENASTALLCVNLALVRDDVHP